VDALLVLQRSDVAHLVAHRERFAGLPLLCTDPGILDTVLQAGFTDYALRRIDTGPELAARVYAEAVTRATHIDLLLTAERERLFGPGRWLGWDRGGLFQSLQVMFTARALRPALEQALPEPRIGLLRPDSPLLFNFDSMVQPDIVGADPRRWCVLGRYEAGRFWNPLLLQACFDFEGIAHTAARGPVQALTHLGSCFYDVQAFSRAVTEAFANNIDLPSVYCDVPLRRERVLLANPHELPARWRDERCGAYRERARAVFEAQLADLIPQSATRATQAEAWAARSYLQAVNYLGLKQALAGQQPHIVVADHDNGHLGVLFSLAATLGSAVTVLPHSGYTNAPLPHAQRVTAIERAGYGTRVRTLLGQPVATRAVRFRTPSQPQPRAAARRVCVLVNTMYADGQYHVDLFSLRRLFHGLRELCQARGAQLEVRLKPSTPALSVVAGALGEPAAYFAATAQRAIDDVAVDTDLCVAWGELTTGCINFLDAASLVLHASDEDWPVNNAPQAPFLDDGLIDSLHIDTALARIARLLADPAHYQAQQGLQAERYARRRAGAHDTFFPSPSEPGSTTPC
jgi:hypothetical protein